MLNLLKLLLFIAINFNQFSNQLGNQYCPDSIVHDVVWYESEKDENYLVSDPLCLDNIKMIVTRNCTGYGWKPANDEIGCNSYQSQFIFDEYCPNGYVEIYNTRICILIMKSQQWSTDCVQRGSMIDMRQLIRSKPKIIKFLKDLEIDRFWLPANRDNNTEFLKWKLPPPLWNLHITFDEATLPIDNNGDCLSMNVNMLESMENCSTELPLVCLFDKNTETIIMKSFCTGSSVSARLEKYRETCFHIKPIIDLTGLNSLALIDTLDTYFVVQSVIQDFKLINSPILIDLIPGQNGYFNLVDWGNAHEDLNFIDWDHRLNQTQIVETPFDLYTVVWNKKWNLVDGDLVEYQIIDEQIYGLGDLPKITINYNSTYDGLDVYIENEIRLWKTDEIMFTCFSSENVLQPIIKLDKIEQFSPHWKLSLSYFKGNSQYWCEGVTLNDFVVVKSNVLQVQRNMLHNELIYSVLVEVPCVKCQFYSELNEIQSFIEEMTSMMRETDEFDEIKLQTKKIMKFDTHTSTVTILIHCIVENIHDYSKFEAGNIIRYDMLSDISVIFFRAIDTCFSLNPDFPDTTIGHPSVYKKLCTMENTLLPVQHCGGDLIHGAYWINTYNDTNLQCIENNDTSPSFLDIMNEKLFQLNTMSSRLTWISESFRSEFVDSPAHLHYFTEMLQNMVYIPSDEIFSSTPDKTLNESPINTVSEIIDTVINKNESVLQKAQSEMNTTNLMLETFDEILRKYSTSKSFAMDLEKFSKDGTILSIKPQFIGMISNPLIKNITGIAIYKKGPFFVGENFVNNYSIRKLFGNETYEDIYNNTLEIGVNIPFKTLEQMHMIRNGSPPVPVNRIIFKIFYKDTFFQETHTPLRILKANSKIIGITIPEYHDDHLPPGVFMILKKMMHEIIPRGYGCSDWTMDGTKSGWNKNYERSKMIYNYSVLCHVSRLRNYGFVQLLGNNLMTIEPTESIDDDRFVIFMITIVGCVLSLFGISVIFMTAALIKTWRKREATPLILNICTATGLQLICYLLSETKIMHYHVQCLIIGGTLHYVTIVGFFLSLFVSNLQYRRYIIIIGPSIPKYFKTRLFIFGWIVPLLIVFVCMHVQPESYTPNEELLELGGICYPVGDVLLYAVHIPIILIFCINLSIYVWIIINLNMDQKNLRKSTTRSNNKKQIFLFAYAFFLLSLTWIFGILAHFLNLRVFSYLFVMTSTLQGFFIFLYCFIFDGSIQQVFKTIKF